MKRLVSILLFSAMLIGILSVAPLGASAKAYVSVMKQKTYQTDSGKVTYRIPKINLSGSAAAAVNKEISNTYQSAFTNADKNAAKGVRYSDCYSREINFSSYVNGAVLSVVIKHAYPYNKYVEYKVYNFNIKNGKRLSNSNILKSKGVSAAAANKNIAALLRAEFKSVLNSGNANVRKTASSHLKKSTSAANMKDNLYYLGKNGKLMAKYRIYWIAGSGSYYRLGTLSAYAAVPKITGFKNISSGIYMKWNKVAGAAKYRVYVKTSSGWSKVADIANTAFTYKNAKNGKKFTFTIRALDKNGNSVSSYNKAGFSKVYRKK